MLIPSARHPQSHKASSFLAALMLVACAAACDVYDATLVQIVPLQDSSVPPPTDAGKDAHIADASDTDGSMSEPECTYMAESEFCPVSCKERCNGQDDDCDRLIDESGSGDLCKLQSATSVCVTGTCLIASCDEGRVDCNDQAEDGCEATLDSIEHCGLCSNRCELAHATPKCDASQCKVAACDDGWDDCDGKPANGCERELNVLTDCGGCGSICRMTHATTECGSGACRFSACETGWGDCNNDTNQTNGGDGCETDLGAPANCGACGATCPGDKPYCTGGKCTSIACAPGSADCNGDNVMCETDLRTVNNCGACGVACGSVANASVSCSEDGTCEPTCNGGFDSCDNSFSNGCETNIRTLPNCGACGTSCSHSNATSSCGDGNCTLALCNSGYGDCNSNKADGCEVRLNTATHCGQCGRPCALSNAASSCSSGSCQVSGCNSNFGNCDANASNGCETNLQTSAQHCGACGAACPANFVCQAGRCVCDSNSDCASGQTCCGGSCIDTRTSESNCGACGTSCGSGQTCCSGTCRTLATDFNNCGSCGRTCGSNSNRCTNGACRCTTDSPCSGFYMCCSNGCHTPLLCD
jgi:hypothetical protein